MTTPGFQRLYRLFRQCSFLALLILGPASSFAAPTVLLSRSQPGVKVTFQETHICETTHSVRSYAGYITLPASLDPILQPYESNLFFWFFEARSNPNSAPLTLWLQGGPGLGSTIQAVSGHNGPCIVQGDSNSTVRNPWSWNGVSNMLYLDQPVQTGYSYDKIHDGFMDMLTSDVVVDQTSLPAPNMTVRTGKFGSQNPAMSANTTALAAAGVAHFLEIWFQKFNQYKRNNINIWSQSYGGHYAPAVASILTKTRKKCRSGHHGNTFTIGVDSVGIINGFIDPVLQMNYFPTFAVNNTYGIKAYDDSVAEQIVDNLNQPGGCKDQTSYCVAQQAASDPNNYGNNDTVNNICLGVFSWCWENVYGPFEALSGRNPFDIAHLIPDSFPPPYAVGYLNNKWVQKALGAKINYTAPEAAVSNTFVLTGDYLRSYSGDLGNLLDAGVKVALLHGDRDFRCNWFGGEAVSLSIPHSGAAAFAAAGYAELKTTTSHVGGRVRQHGLLSFSRVFQAGHEVPYYQPETAYAIFVRTLQGRDVATGNHAASHGYSTTGPASVAHVSSGSPPPQAPVECYVDLAPVNERCSEAQVAALVDGSAVVVDRVVVSPAA